MIREVKEEDITNDKMNVSWELPASQVTSSERNNQRNNALPAALSDVTSWENLPDSPSQVSFHLRINFESLRFSKDSHRCQFVSFVKQVNYRVACFSITSLPHREELEFVCNVCGLEITSVQKAVEHLQKDDHWFNSESSFSQPISSAVSDRDWLFLEYRPEFGNYVCSLCEEELVARFSVWVDHFTGNVHRSKSDEIGPQILERELARFLSQFETSRPTKGKIENLEESVFLSASPENYTSIFEGFKNLGPSTLVHGPRKFKNRSHEKSYEKMLETIKDQIQFFQITSKESEKNLGVVCTLCNVPVAAKIVKEHSTSHEHLVKLMAQFANKESKMFLSGVKLIACTLCKVLLLKEKKLWFQHFQSAFHNMKLKEFHAKISNISEDAGESNSSKKLAGLISTDKFINIFTEIQTSDWVLSKVSSQKKFKRSPLEFQHEAHQHEYNVLCSEVDRQITFFQFISEADVRRLRVKCTLCAHFVNVAKEHVTSREHILKMMEPFVGEESRGFVEYSRSTLRCSLCDVALFVYPGLQLEHFQSKSHQLKLQELGKNHESWNGIQVDLIVNGKEGSESVFEQTIDTKENKPTSLLIRNANPCMGQSVALKNDNASNFSNHTYDLTSVQFADFFHSTQFVKLIQSINDEVNHFLFESRPESRNLKFICKFCNKSFVEANAAAAHVRTKEHSSRFPSNSCAAIPVVKDCAWAFLKPQTTRKCYLCKCCQILLPSEFPAWVEHFQSEAHSEKSEEKTESGIKSGLCGAAENLSAAPVKQIITGSLGANQVERTEAVPRNLTLKSSDNTFETRRPLPEPSCPPPVPLKNTLEDSKFLSPSFKKFKLKALITKLGDHVPFFLIDCTHLDRGTVKINCLLCRVSLPLTKVIEHAESKTHLLSVISPLISEENKKYLDWCDATKSFNCSICSSALTWGQCLLKHFQSSDHTSKLVGLSPELEEVASNEAQQACFFVPAPKRLALSAEIESVRNMQKAMKLFCPYFISQFLRLASDIKHQINFFLFKPCKTLNYTCRLCKITFIDVGSAMNHVKQSIHMRNFEKNKMETVIVPWIPSVCHDNWKFLWPDPHERIVFCILCRKVLSNEIPTWLLHFESKLHRGNVSELNCNLLTAATT